jgi:hypothetical protein
MRGDKVKDKIPQQTNRTQSRETMYLMFGDEADAEQGRGQKFFVYGAVFIKAAEEAV